VPPAPCSKRQREADQAQPSPTGERRAYHEARSCPTCWALGRSPTLDRCPYQSEFARTHWLKGYMLGLEEARASVRGARVEKILRDSAPFRYPSTDFDDIITQLAEAGLTYDEWNEALLVLARARRARDAVRGFRALARRARARAAEAAAAGEAARCWSGGSRAVAERGRAGRSRPARSAYPPTGSGIGRSMPLRQRGTAASTSANTPSGRVLNSTLISATSVATIW
jgi:hypothetical protein